MGQEPGGGVFEAGWLAGEGGWRKVLAGEKEKALAESPARALMSEWWAIGDSNSKPID